MKLELVVNEKPIELDEYLNEEEMGLPPFQFSLEELAQYITGHINIIFNSDCIIKLDLFYDFSLCIDDIIDSIINTKNGNKKDGVIWFCEQGSDFYLNYKIKNNNIVLAYKKGKKTGGDNSNVIDFTISVNKIEYINEWGEVFKNIINLFEEKLHKKIEIPF